MPISGDVLLDTSVIIPYFRGEANLRQSFKSAALFLPLIVLGELYCGANLATNPHKQLELIHSFLPAVTVKSPGTGTAEHYGRIRAILSKAGTPIPENDIWISALAMEHRMALATRDTHFNQIKDLQILNW